MQAIQLVLALAVFVVGVILASAAILPILSLIERRGGGAIFRSTPSSLIVQGYGSVRAPPTEARLRLGIQTLAPTAKESAAQAAQTMTSVLAAIKEQGVESHQMQTGAFSLAPKYQYERDAPPQLMGYTTSNMVAVTIANLDSVGAILDAVIEAGGDSTRIEGVRFTTRDPAVAQEQAREKALADARRQAEQIARTMGVTLGKPIAINRAANEPAARPMHMMRANVAMSADFETPIQAGELEVEISVDVEYAIH